ncbi:hypothetical protein LPE509_02091 [Legionella pneumophila subsp. pneumophila LPE509]|nr:hypothetical protein LPE509_02091 [Legionella pneumophila subsp. pneumophila LPE509]
MQMNLQTIKSLDGKVEYAFIRGSKITVAVTYYIYKMILID